jgi:hypothetical protein
MIDRLEPLDTRSRYRDALLAPLARLAAKGARVEVGDDGNPVVVEASRSGATARRHPLSAHVLAMACREGWLVDRTGKGSWTLSPAGAAELRRLRSTPAAARGEAASRPSAGKQASPAGAIRGRRTGPPASVGAAGQSPQPPTPAVDPLESPLAWLRCRRDKTGKPFLSDEEFAAGERLRADFWFARMTPRTTTDWSRFALGGAGRTSAGGPGGVLEIAERALAAQNRVRRALAAIGPDLSDILIDTCAHLKGLSEIERERGLSQRAGKDVLVLALRSLARHYGYLPSGADRVGAGVREWQASPVTSQREGETHRATEATPTVAPPGSLGPRSQI